MATHRLPIVDWHRTRDPQFPLQLSRDATNDQWQHVVYKQPSQSSTQRIHNGFVVPKNYVGSPVFVVVWTSSITSGDVVFRVIYRPVGGNDVESLDQATGVETLTVTDTAPGAAWRRMEATMAATAGNFVVDDEVECQIDRVGADAGDTLAGATYLIAALFEYADA